jgi:hypothetical protein
MYKDTEPNYVIMLGFLLIISFSFLERQIIIFLLRSRQPVQRHLSTLGEWGVQGEEGLKT